MSVPHDKEYETIATGSATVSVSVVDLTAFGFTAAQLQTATRAVISNHNTSVGGVSFTYDGTLPTTKAGHNLNREDEPLVVWGNVYINSLKFIRDHQGTDGIVTITLEGPQAAASDSTPTTPAPTTTTTGMPGGPGGP